MNSKIFTFFVILSISVCFFSCRNEGYKKELIMEVLNIETNYFDNDSLQKISGYYPARVYVILKVVNTYPNPVYIPLRAKNDTIIKSQINIHDPSDIVKSSYTYMFSKSILNPNDSLYIEFVVALKDDSSQIIRKLSHFAEDVQFSYEFNKNDSTILNATTPSNVVIKKVKNLSMKYRSQESLNEEVDWIL